MDYSLLLAIEDKMWNESLNRQETIDVQNLMRFDTMLSRSSSFNYSPEIYSTKTTRVQKRERISSSSDNRMDVVFVEESDEENEFEMMTEFNEGDS